MPFFHQFPCSKYMTPVLEHWNIVLIFSLFRIVCLTATEHQGASLHIVCWSDWTASSVAYLATNTELTETCPIRNVSCLQMSVVWSSHGSLAIFQAWSAKRNTSADQYQRAPDVIKWDQSRYDNKKTKKKNEEEEKKEEGSLQVLKSPEPREVKRAVLWGLLFWH